MNEAIETVGCIGYGEVGAAAAEALGERGYEVVVTNRSPADLAETLHGTGIAVADSPSEVAARSDLVLSCVWPATALSVGRDAADGIGAGTRYLDLNAISPRTTDELARLVAGAGGSFQKGSIFGSVGRRGTAVQVVLAGEDLPLLVEALEGVGFEIAVLDGDVAQPAALKMHRSLVTKGLRALFVETLVSARYYGLDEETLESVSDAFERRTLSSWVPKAITNTATHGERRIGELREIVETTHEAGVHSPIAEEALELHEYVVDEGIEPDDYRAMLDRLAERYRRR